MAKESVEEKVKELEEEIIKLKIHVTAKDRGLEEEKKVIVDYMEKEFATHKLVINEIVEGAKVEFTSQRYNLQQLYETTVKELEAMKERLQEVETKGAPNGKERFLAAKHMLPRTFDKQEDWKQWKGEVEDYCDVIMEGTKDVLEEVRNKRDTIEETDVKDKWWKIQIRPMEIAQTLYVGRSKTNHN